MKLSQAIAKRRDIVVEFEGASLQVQYRPASFTIRELDELSEETNRSGKPSRRLLETVKRIIIQWDLTDDYNNIIKIDTPLDDPNDPLLDVPSVVFTEIMKKINEDQTPGGDRASSGR